MPLSRFGRGAAAVLIACLPAAPSARQPSPDAIARELLAADRAFSTAAAGRSLVDAFDAMFRDDVVMPVPGAFATGREAVIAALKGNPANLTAHATWTPLRAGISADGTHGFTFGLMTIRDGSAARHAKYMAYWIKDGAGWRVAVYKRAAAATASEPMPVMMEPSLPGAIVAGSKEAAEIAAYGESLKQAEQAFSDEAQTIGLGPAFAKHGREDAVNMGGPDQPGYTVGANAIAAAVGGDGGGPSPVSWSAERTIVAPSGDLGISMGFIRSNDPAAGRPPFAFFTIWRRDSPSAPWRYIAE
jgi:ketosteroid isomerase-like protein